MSFTQLLGFIGTALVLIAYYPQIHHLIKEKCSQGISLRAYTLWLLSALLLLSHAIAIASLVFIVLSSFHIVSTAIILLYSYKVRNRVCQACFKKIEEIRSKPTNHRI